MDISGSVDQILVKAGKQTDVRFIFNLNDEQVIQLVEWRRRGLVLHIEPMAEQLPLVTTPETFTIDDVEFPILPQDERGYQLTGQQIKDLVLYASNEGSPEEEAAAVERAISATLMRNEGDEDGGPVANDEIVTITAGMRFCTGCQPSDDDEEVERTPADLVAIGQQKAAVAAAN